MLKHGVGRLFAPPLMKRETGYGTRSQGVAPLTVGGINCDEMPPLHTVYVGVFSALFKWGLVTTDPRSPPEKSTIDSMKAGGKVCSSYY